MAAKGKSAAADGKRKAPTKAATKRKAPAPAAARQVKRKVVEAKVEELKPVHHASHGTVSNRAPLDV